MNSRTLAWRKSSYSTGTGNCVEVAPVADGAVVRHSKHPGNGTIAFSDAEWTAFVRAACEGLPSWNGAVEVSKVGGGTVVKSRRTDVVLRFDEGEWSAFVAGAADGEFDFPVRRGTTMPS